DLGFRQTVRRLLDSGKKVVFVIDNPELLVDPKACVERPFPFGHPECAIDVTAEQTQVRNQDFDMLVAQHSNDFPQVQFFSARSVFCDDAICRARKGHELWFASRDHLTPAGSRRVAVGLNALIDASLAPP
ncbi:MAG TPA: SGNH hydrolase domain-containing protein, partial [Burkholderiaceae bacterium]|nr:SGNH hydrolase domain-containing protein [Burkholderiaceae bacterium]